MLSFVVVVVVVVFILCLALLLTLFSLIIIFLLDKVSLQAILEQNSSNPSYIFPFLYFLVGYEF